jgi:hypothetical protein
LLVESGAFPQGFPQNLGNLIVRLRQEEVSDFRFAMSHIRH